MQEQQIYQMAVSEDINIHTFGTENVMFYRGFRIAKDKHNNYFWQDIRYSEYYEVVDPLITENIIEHGFCDTLTKVMIHSDKEKLLDIVREIEKLDMQTEHWTRKSTDNYNKFKKQNDALLSTAHSFDQVIHDKMKNLEEKYNNRRELFQKKRRILKEEKDDLRADYAFFESRIRLYKDN